MTYFDRKMTPPEIGALIGEVFRGYEGGLCGGWIDTHGNFFPSMWGAHQHFAAAVLTILGENKEADEGRDLHRFGDFLIQKGWLLIDDPERKGWYYVTKSDDKMINKEQSKALFDFFAREADQLERVRNYWTAAEKRVFEINKEIVNKIVENDFSFTYTISDPNPSVLVSQILLADMDF